MADCQSLTDSPMTSMTMFPRTSPVSHLSTSDPQHLTILHPPKVLVTLLSCQLGKHESRQSGLNRGTWRGQQHSHSCLIHVVNCSTCQKQIKYQDFRLIAGPVSCGMFCADQIANKIVLQCSQNVSQKGQGAGHRAQKAAQKQPLTRSILLYLLTQNRTCTPSCNSGL